MKTETTLSDLNANPSALTYTVDSFANGIAFGQHKLDAGLDPRDFYSLRIQDDSEMLRLRSRYALNKTNPLFELEKHLMRLSSQGVLRSATIYLGTTTDPFFPFEGKFDASMKFLQLFTKYTPGMLIIQTRSPLIVLAMPVFKALGKRAAVTMAVETNLEESVRRYTPGLPQIADRLQAATALRRFGIEVSLQVSPVLPYGDWRGDARRFAQTLVDHGDHIYVQSITDGSEKVERRVRATELARRLARDRKFHWLRPDTATPLISEIEQLAPSKLKIPERKHMSEKQMSIFAA
jgi:DNA repair photolyase